jgi:hypothetical protein
MEEEEERPRSEDGGFTSGLRTEDEKRSEDGGMREEESGKRVEEGGMRTEEGLAGFGLASAGMSGAEGRRSRAVRSSRPGSAQACREAWGCAMPYAGPVCRRRRSRSAGHGPAGPLPRIRAAARAGGSREPQPHACQEERSWAQG